MLKIVLKEKIAYELVHILIGNGKAYGLHGECHSHNFSLGLLHADFYNTQ